MTINYYQNLTSNTFIRHTLNESQAVIPQVKKYYQLWSFILNHSAVIVCMYCQVVINTRFIDQLLVIDPL